MSVQIDKDETARLLIVRASGKLTKEDYARFVPAVESFIREVGKLRLLFEMHGFHGWTAGALWEDVKFDLHHFADIERLALVGDTKWQEGMAVFCKPFTKANVEYFPSSRRAEALAWLREGIE